MVLKDLMSEKRGSGQSWKYREYWWQKKDWNLFGMLLLWLSFSLTVPKGNLPYLLKPKPNPNSQKKKGERECIRVVWWWWGKGEGAVDGGSWCPCPSRYRKSDGSISPISYPSLFLHT